MAETLRGNDGDAAILGPHGSHQASLSYGELRRAVTRGAAALRDRGAAPGRSIGVAVRDPRGFVVAALAVWESGAAVVPLAGGGSHPTGTANAARAHALATVTEASDDGSLSIEPGDPDGTIDRRAALVLFTSGSSAEPKGVLLSGSGLLANVRAILSYLPMAEFSRTAVVVPLWYSYGLVGQVLTSLHAGGALALLNDLPYPVLQLEAMRRLRIRGLSAIPFSLRQLARAATELAPDERPEIGYIASAGGPLDAATRDLVGATFPGARLFNQYGLTEASPRVTALSDREPAFARGSVGRALDGIEIYAASPENERLPPLALGQLTVRGPSVMLGYLDDPEGSRRVLSESGALSTGDSGYVDEEGYVFVAGRIDGVVKCAGERVSLEEVASVMRSAAGVRDACVVATPHDELGMVLIAFVEAAQMEVPALKKLARQELAPAKRPLRIVAMDSLPRTPNGKVARSELDKRAKEVR